MRNVDKRKSTKKDTTMNNYNVSLLMSYINEKKMKKKEV